MVRIIETNLSVARIDNEEHQIKDFQSRIIKHTSWDDFINEIKNKECKNHEGTLIGCTLPRQSKVDNLKYDDFHLSCDVYNYQGIKTKKLAYLITSTIP